MNKQQIAYDISLTMGDHQHDYNIPAMVNDIVETYGYIKTLDDIPSDEYQLILANYDISA